MTITFELKGFKVLIDNDDLDLISINWRLNYRDGDKPYVENIRQENNKRIYSAMHRVIMERVLGRRLLPTELVDHWDNNPCNNTRGNLRVATRTQNQANRGASKSNKLGIKGVSLYRGKYRAQIQVNKKVIQLGRFDTPEQAHAAYMKAAIEHFGDFARGD